MRIENKLTASCCTMLLLSASIASRAEAETSRCGSEDSAHAIRYAGLGSLPSRDKALPFGAALLPMPQSGERVVAFHPDGKELFFTRLAAPGPQIMRSEFRDGSWQAPELASFSNIGINTEPSISPDGRRLYFVSTRPPSLGTDIWRTDRTDSGWSTPVRLSDAINSSGNEWHPQVSANGDLYFAADDRKGYGDADLYVAKFEREGYRPAENLGDSINTAAAEWDAYVDPAEKFMLFKSNRAGGYGGMDMYISHHERTGWSKAANLGPAINTADDEDSGEITPDKCFVIFARRPNATAPWSLFWVNADALP